MPSATLPTIEKQLGSAPTHSVIWLHGLGANGFDFYHLLPELALPPTVSARFIFPHAPHLPVTINGGMQMPAWYDIVAIDGIDRRIDIAGIETSLAAIRALIAREVEQGIAEHNIILAGFSQGGVISLLAALTHERRLGGILALSTYLPAREHWTFSAANQDIPIFIGHGSQDPVVPHVLGLQIRSLLDAAGYHPEWHSYPMAHSLCPAEIQDISVWLSQRLQPAAG